MKAVESDSLGNLVPKSSSLKCRSVKISYLKMFIESIIHREVLKLEENSQRVADLNT